MSRVHFTVELRRLRELDRRLEKAGLLPKNEIRYQLWRLINFVKTEARTEEARGAA